MTFVYTQKRINLKLKTLLLPPCFKIYHGFIAQAKIKAKKHFTGLYEITIQIGSLLKLDRWLNYNAPPF